MCRSLMVILLLTIAFTLPPITAEAGKKRIKIATVAPEGSIWWKTLKEADKRLRALSGGKMQLRIYAGGVAGDESALVKKMRIGQLQGAALTNIGLSSVQPATLVLQAPGLFRTWDELTATRAKLRHRLEELLAEKGFYTLVWGDVGFNRIFSTKKIRLPEDLQGTKPWCWTQDGSCQAFFTSLGVKPVLLGLPEVLPGLQTGLIDTYTVPPLAGVSVQWFTRSKYVLDYPMSVTIGAVLLTKTFVDSLTPEELAWLEQVGEELGPELSKSVLAGNKQAMAAIRKAGIEVITTDDAMRKAWIDAASKGAKAAVGKVYSQALLDEVVKAVSEHRQQNR